VVELVAKIEDPRKSGPGPVFVAPRPVVVLGREEVTDAARDRFRFEVSAGEQSEQGPSGLRRGRRSHAFLRGIVVARIRLAPGSTLLLMRADPVAGAAETKLGEIFS